MELNRFKRAEPHAPRRILRCLARQLRSQGNLRGQQRILKRRLQGTPVENEPRHRNLIANHASHLRIALCSAQLMTMTYYSYICSRLYLHHPPGEEKRPLNYLATTPEELREKERQLQAANPRANQYVVLAMLVIVIGIMAATAEWVGHIHTCKWMTNG